MIATNWTCHHFVEPGIPTLPLATEGDDLADVAHLRGQRWAGLVCFLGAFVTWAVSASADWPSAMPEAEFRLAGFFFDWSRRSAVGHYPRHDPPVERHGRGEGFVANPSSAPMEPTRTRRGPPPSASLPPILAVKWASSSRNRGSSRSSSPRVATEDVLATIASKTSGAEARP